MAMLWSFFFHVQPYFIAHVFIRAIGKTSDDLRRRSSDSFRPSLKRIDCPTFSTPCWSRHHLHIHQCQLHTLVKCDGKSLPTTIFLYSKASPPSNANDIDHICSLFGLDHGYPRHQLSNSLPWTTQVVRNLLLCCCGWFSSDCYSRYGRLLKHALWLFEKRSFLFLDESRWNFWARTRRFCILIWHFLLQMWWYHSICARHLALFCQYWNGNTLLCHLHLSYRFHAGKRRGLTLLSFFSLQGFDFSDRFDQYLFCFHWLDKSTTDRARERKKQRKTLWISTIFIYSQSERLIRWKCWRFSS